MNLRVWLKIGVILGMVKFVSGYVERDKEMLKNSIFAPEYLRILLRSSAAGAQLLLLNCGG